MIVSYIFKNFFKKYWWLILILILIPIIAIVSFCIAFRKELHEISAWASMIAGIATYIGTIILSLFVFYNSWKVEFVASIKNLKCDKIKIRLTSIEGVKDEGTGKSYLSICKIDKEKFRFGYRVMGTEFLDIEKCNMFTVSYKITDEKWTKSIIPTNIYYEKCGKLYRCNNFYYLKDIENKEIHFAISNDDIPMHYYKIVDHIFVYVEFKIINIFGGKYYYYHNFIYGETLGFFTDTVISEKTYQERIEKYGTPIEISSANINFVNHSNKKRDNI